MALHCVAMRLFRFQMNSFCCHINALQYDLTPVPAVTASLGLSSTSDAITFDQNWHHLCSTSAGGKDLSNDAQIRVVIG